MEKKLLKIRYECENGRVAFVITSPFQALCCIEAIQQFNITSYHIYVMVYNGFNKREKQVVSLFNSYNINNISIRYCSKFSFVTFFITNIIPSFDVVFTGDFYSSSFVLFSVLNIKKGGDLVYLDDGNSTLGILMNQLETFKLNGFITKLIIAATRLLFRLKNIDKKKTFYTIYSDIENSNYHIIPDFFSSLAVNREMKINVVLFIGTSPSSFIRVNNINEEFYRKVLFDSLSSLSAINKVIYIPHGQDTDSSVEKFCIDNGVEYRRTDTCIENYVLREGWNPIEIYGFTSSALFTLKKMYPQSHVTDIRIVSSEPNEEYEIISNYYSNHGIIVKRINITNICND